MAAPYSRRRSRLELKMAILRACVTPTSSTNIMFAVRISWAGLQLRLKELMKGGYLEFKPAGRRESPSLQGRVLGFYTLTSKGADALRGFESLNGGLLEGGRGSCP